MSKLRLLLLVLVSAASAWPVLGASPARAAGFSDRDLKAFDANTLIYIATVRKDGNESKAAPVWFTLSQNRDQLLIQTGPDTWKAKRIRRGSPALIWIGKADGPAFIGKAEITRDPDVINKILTDFQKRYTMNFMLGPKQKDFDSGNRVAIRITPVRDMPDGTESKPGTPAPALEASK